MTKFPGPLAINQATKRWRLSDLMRYEAEIAGNDPATVRVERESFLTDKQVAERYGVSRPTVWRWSAGGEQVAA